MLWFHHPNEACFSVNLTTCHCGLSKCGSNPLMWHVRMWKSHTVIQSPEPNSAADLVSLLFSFLLGILWDSTGRLHIANPGANDVGIYRCTAKNKMGSDSETTQVLLAGES